MNRTKVPGLRQAMAALHTWTGLLFGWVLYAMFLTGAASYFHDEISQWMRPELPALLHLPAASHAAENAIEQLKVMAPHSTGWDIELPSHRTNVTTVQWTDGGLPERAILDPLTGDRRESRATQGGELFYYFHFSLHYLPRLAGRWLVGLAAMFMLVALISGVITHKKIFTHFFTFRPGTGQRSWLDGHNAASVLGLPFHLVITYTGLVTLMTLYMPWGADAAFGAQARQKMREVMIASPTMTAPTGSLAPLASVVPMVLRAERDWGAGNVGRMVITHPGDEAARVLLVRSDRQQVSVAPRSMVFDGTNGSLLAQSPDVSPVAQAWGAFYGLHVARFADRFTRWMLFVVGLIGAAMVGTGLILWVVKRTGRTRAERGAVAPLHQAVAGLNVAVIAGLPAAMAGYFWANRLIPLALPHRADWEAHVMFILWGLLLLDALLRLRRIAVLQIWQSQLTLGALLFGLLPVLNAITTGRHLGVTLANGDWVFAGFDLTALAIAALLGGVAYRLRRRQVGMCPRQQV